MKTREPFFLMAVVVGLSAGVSAAADSQPGRDSAAPPARVFASDDSLVKPLLGVYRSDADPRGHVMIGSLGHRTLQVTCGAYDAVGFWDGSQFTGVLRVSRSGGMGELSFRYLTRDTIRAVVRMHGGVEPVTETWVRVGSFGDDSRSPRPDERPSGDLPKLGESVYVEELPEAITKVPPQYPDDARRQRIEGTVLLQALVGRDGRIKDTRVVKSIPGLDAAAQEAVRQWVFKPALAKGDPVAVWVAIPVKFSLH